ncbi:hypothetical protein BDW72DRAFT_212924 [Aspergillus terricola var. indicus]
MHYHGIWLLTIGALRAALATSSSASTTEKNILRVDLVFPRNKTYKSTEWFPIVFAFQNPQRAQYLNIDLTYSIYPHDTNTQNDTTTLFHDLRWTDWSSHDPYFAHNFLDGFNSSGHWNLACFSIWFTIAAQDVEIKSIDVGITAIAINVTDKTMSVPDFVNWCAADWTNNTCSVVSPTLVTPDPCRVEVDRTVVESMQAPFKVRRCQGFNPPDDSPKTRMMREPRSSNQAGSCLCPVP